jgi:hypothetical protein
MDYACGTAAYIVAGKYGGVRLIPVIVAWAIDGRGSPSSKRIELGVVGTQLGVWCALKDLHVT